MTLKSQATSGVRWNSIALLVTTIVQSVTLVVLARLLLPEDFGLMAMVMIVIGFAQAYSDGGVSAAIIYRQDATCEQLSSLYWLNLLAGVAVFLSIWIMTPAVALFFGDSRLSPLLRYVGLTFLIIPCGKQFEILLQRDLRFGLLAKIQVLAVFLSAAVTLATAFAGHRVWALVWGQLSQAASMTTLLALVGWRDYRPRFHFGRDDLRGYVGFGMYQMGERSINFFAERLDQLILGTLLGAQALGYYNFAFNLAILPLDRINPIVNKVAFPVFAKVQNDMALLQRSYTKILNLLTMVNAPLLIGLAVVSPLAIPLIFGDQWVPAVGLAQVLSLVALSRCTGNPVGSLLLAKGRADLGFGWNVLFLLVSVPTIYMGARLGDAFGVAVALLMLQLAVQLPAYLYLIRPLIGRCGFKYAEFILRPIVFALIMAGAVRLVNFAPLAGWSMLLAQVIVGGSVYVAVLWVSDRAQMLELRDLVFNSPSAPG